MSQEIAITALAFRKCAEKFQDPFPKINRQRQDCAKLNDDRVHFPKAVSQIEMEQRFDDAQMSGRAHRQKFGQSFNDTEQDRQ